MKPKYSAVKEKLFCNITLELFIFWEVKCLGEYHLKSSEFIIFDHKCNSCVDKILNISKTLLLGQMLKKITIGFKLISHQVLLLVLRNQLY